MGRHGAARLVADVAAEGRALRWQNALALFAAAAPAQQDARAFGAAIGSSVEVHAAALASRLAMCMTAHCACAWVAAVSLLSTAQRKQAPGNAGAITKSRAAELQSRKTMTHVIMSAGMVLMRGSLIGCFGASQWATAVEVLAGMVRSLRAFSWMLPDSSHLEQGLRDKVVAFGASISVCEKASQWQAAVQLLKDMDCGMTPSAIACLMGAKLHGSDPSVKSQTEWEGNAAIAACFDQWPVALSLLHRAPLTDAGSFAAVITSLGRGTQWTQALSLLDEMEERELQPDILAFSSTISACEKGAQWETALILLGSMAQKKVPPNVFSYASAVSACEKCQKWLEEQMLLETVEPNDMTLSAIMVAVSEQGLWEYCLGILQSYRSSVQCPNTAAFNAAISACEKGKRWQMALALIFDTQPIWKFSA
ncbi:Pentatricopeptide repeat-containing protein, mitochondrial [Symbiodinium microadriaticum]|uniref:Pentatricopeptide repeat-containing protein, mitochondrial n=1 Tax=Symbiodinium microadriaticum TaxID=2951 RepID=A0A1Q9EG89_SYMMI|nr:Pentatricopeptide repeat-containing protein, mitochondrial [Symbiodinium microadriaticum]